MNPEDEDGEQSRHEAARLVDVMGFPARTLGLDNVKFSQKAKIPVSYVASLSLLTSCWRGSRIGQVYTPQ